MSILSGKIIQLISGFYYVEAADMIYECKAKGSFRNKKITPLVGDDVIIETSEEKGIITEILPRKNFLTRPPIANIDILFIVVSINAPKPNCYIIDKMTAFALYHKIEPIIIFSKCDLADPSQYLDIYSKTPFKIICCSAENGSGINLIEENIQNKVCAFTGNSGVGKSSLLNAIDKNLAIPTNDISTKLGRGRHTTRTVSLYKIQNGFIADTPGFSSLEFEKYDEKIYKDELFEFFPDIALHTDKCKFGLSCSHICDKGCGVINAVNEGFVSLSRHESYTRMYNEVKNFNKWD